MTDLSDYIRTFYTFFVTSAGILATVMIMFGGYRWITAGGNSSKISEAKETIISAALGLVLALTSYVILNTINPDITALKKLEIPIVQPMAVEGSASRLCDFNLEINTQTNLPVTCGEVIYPTNQNGQVAAEKCLGIWSAGDENYCQVTTIGSGTSAAKTGTEKSLINITNHPSGYTEFNVNNGPAYQSEWKQCGVVWFDSLGSHKYFVGNGCPELLDKKARCYLDGDTGSFASDPSISECSGLSGFIEYFGELLTAAEIKAGCGHITNMQCKN